MPKSTHLKVVDFSGTLFASGDGFSCTLSHTHTHAHTNKTKLSLSSPWAKHWKTFFSSIWKLPPEIYISHCSIKHYIHIGWYTHVYSWTLSVKSKGSKYLFLSANWFPFKGKTSTAGVFFSNIILFCSCMSLGRISSCWSQGLSGRSRSLWTTPMASQSRR